MKNSPNQPADNSEENDRPRIIGGVAYGLLRLAYETQYKEEMPEEISENILKNLPKKIKKVPKFKK